MNEMRSYGWDAVKLSNAYTLDELSALRLCVEAENANPRDAGGHPTENGRPTIHIYSATGRKKLTAITWAITYLLDDKRRETAERAA